MAREYKCEDCSGDIDCPMIHDETWDSKATQETLLCLSCFETRLGRAISLEDLRPCPWTDSIKVLVGRARAGQI